MAGIRPPGQFNFTKPDEWPKWKKRFKQFRSASKLSTELDTQQINTLLYCLGEEAESVLASAGFAVAPDTKYDAVMEKFDAHFKVRMIFERARFNRRSQREGESIEQYITELYNLIEFCEYGELKEEMLRDRLVVGIRDTALSEKLQTDSRLTLDTAKTMVRQKAAVKDQQRQLQTNIKEATVGRLHHSGSKPTPPSKPRFDGHDKVGQTSTSISPNQSQRRGAVYALWSS